MTFLASDRWLALATSREKGGGLAHVHGCMAADGFRMHVDNTLSPDCATCAGKQPPETFPENASQILELARSGPVGFTLSLTAFRAAAKSAKAFQTDDLHLAVNGRFETFAFNSDFGHSYSAWTGRETVDHQQAGILCVERIVYVHEGPDAEVDVDPDYVLAALRGFDAPVRTGRKQPPAFPVIDCRLRPLDDGGGMLHLKAGEREAVIMGRHTRFTMAAYRPTA